MKKSEQEFSLQDIKQYGTMVLFVAAIIGVLAVFVIVVYPRFLTIQKSWSKISQNKEQISKLKQKLSVLNSLNEDDLKDAIERSQLYLPVENDVSELLGFLGSRTAESEVALGDFNISGSGLRSSNDLDLDLQINGEQEKLFAFNRILKSSGRTIAVNTLGLSFTNKESTLSAILTEELQLTSIAEPFSKSVDAVDAILPQLTVQEQELLSEIQLIQRIIPEDKAPEFPEIGRAHV